VNPGDVGDSSPSGGRFVIANLGSGTLSLIDGDTYEIVGTYALPAQADDKKPEPVYMAAVPRYRRVFVSERANRRVVAFDERDFSLVGTVPTGAATFPHIWADPQGRQLWVTNDIDRTITVVEPGTLTVLATLPLPADLGALGGMPHDVIVDPDGRFAYVSVLGVAGDHDYVLQYDTTNFAEVRRAAVGKEPHLSLARQRPWLYVPCQVDGMVLVLSLESLALQTALPIPRAHGVAMARNGQYLYVSSVPSYDPAPPNGALYTIDTGSHEIVGEPVSSPYPFPHNLVPSNNGHVLVLTHSGPTQDKVSIYEIHYPDAQPVLVREVTVGFNPFGLVYLP
jgi:DNA-binding beta-propeller fold protein YncE